jgi:type VI secretion system protein ImpJ
MKRQPRVVWTKGMFLAPQHFQAQDRYFEDLIHSRFEASHFANYGVSELSIDRESLAKGLFKLLGARGVMPDGEFFDMADSDPLPESRQFVPHWPSGEQTLDVFLSLPERRLNAPNVALSGQTAGVGSGSSSPASDARYTAAIRQLPDENQGSDERAVQLGKKNFRLMFGAEHRGGHFSIRIAQLERNAAGIPILKPSFVAPCLDLSSSTYLGDLLRRQVEILLTKSASLSGPRRERGKAAAGFTAAETDKFWLLHTVNSYLPELKHIFKTRRGHPETAYVAMLRLAGALSTFSLEGGPGDLPDYDHENLGACFTALDNRVRNLMETVIPSKYRSIPLVFTDRFIWSGSIDDDNLFKNSQFYLAVSAGMGAGDIIQKVPPNLKVAAPDDLERVLRNAVAGLGLRHVEVVPPAIPTRLDSQYFQINQSGTLWDKVKLSRRIAAYAPAEIIDPKMEVVVVWE